MSNREISERICVLMGWENFDLFDDIDNERLCACTEPDVVLAYALLNFLRWRLFTEAIDAGVGMRAANVLSAARSEYYYLRLVERQWALREGVEEPLRWIN